MKSISSFKNFINENKESTDLSRLKEIFKPLSRSFTVEVKHEELSGGFESYIDIDGYGDWNKVYDYIDESIKYIKSIGGKLHHIILSNSETGDEVIRNSIERAKNYSSKKDITSIRVWFDI
jgi:gamma-glutamyl phosphate reductase